jgi:hypothetical protein
MPPETVKTRPTAAELATLRAWIDGMAASAGAFRDDAAIERALAADRAALSRDAAPYARWLTVAHLANAGLGDAELEPYRVALAELLASLSWAPAPPAPVAIDAARTLYRIDLRELGWSAATWDTIRAAYPYGVARGAGVPDAIRADWFVATASRPPLYHDLLGLPDTEAGLAHLLGIDLAADVAAGRVARAGFTNSGVSQHNRIVERHATRHGALWRSYDFASSVGVENVFAHPLDFVPAGGELIFNLPNGLQAYMLVDAQGRRIAKAPTTIVSDPRRPDRAVENGLSCMGCHAHGIIDKADQIRDAIGDTVAVADRAEIERLHPRAARLAALYAQDRARFVAALAAIGVTPPADPADEPITRVTARYESELDLRTAAAELGLTADDLTARLDRSEALRAALGGLTVAGGTVKRDGWASAFPRAIAELGVGVPFTPAGGADAAPAVWIDRDRKTWTVLATAAFDHRGATRLCRARGLALPETGELTAAATQGLAAGLRGAARAWTATVKLDASNQRHADTVDPVSGIVRRAQLTERHGVLCVLR